jgi:hypothetical protein
MGEFHGTLYRAGLPGESERRARAIALGQQNALTAFDKTSTSDKDLPAKTDKKESANTATGPLFIVIALAILLIAGAVHRFWSSKTTSEQGPAFHIGRFKNVNSNGDLTLGR